MQPPSQNTADNKTVADASEDVGTPQPAQTEKIEALLESVNSASQHVRNYYITFLLAGFYIAMIIWSTTDLMLLKDTPVKMPLLDVELPITGFYTFAPYFFLLLHFNLLLQFSLLSDKIHRFDRAVIELTDNDSRRHPFVCIRFHAITERVASFPAAALFAHADGVDQHHLVTARHHDRLTGGFSGVSQRRNPVLATHGHHAGPTSFIDILADHPLPRW